MWNVIWCEYWDDERDEPGGVMRDLGAGTLAEVPGLVRSGRHAWSRGGWGRGQVVVTDEAGRRVSLPALLAMSN